MQKSEKISIFNFLDIKLRFLMSWVELIQFLVELSHVKLKICSTWLELSWKCEQLDFKLSWIRLIIKLSFELTFWIWLNSKLSCSYFQLDLSWVEHIFNLTWLNSTRNRVNLTWLIKNLSLTSRELNIEIFPVFCFCITFLHYLFDRKSWRET